MSCFFKQSGQPCVYKFSPHTHCSAEFILATLSTNADQNVKLITISKEKEPRITYNSQTENLDNYEPQTFPKTMATQKTLFEDFNDSGCAPVAEYTSSDEDVILATQNYKRFLQLTVQIENLNH